MSMTPAQVATSLGGDVFIFDYAHADVADSTTLSSGHWGLRKVDGTLSLTDAVRPGVASDGVTSLAGAVTFSINTFQLDTFVSAHVHTEGSGFTVTYTKDGGATWTALAEDGAFALTNTDDLDIKVSFPGGIQNDPSQLTSLTVYVMNTESIKSPSRVLTCSAPSMITSDGLKLTQTASVPMSATPTAPLTLLSTNFDTLDGFTVKTGQAVVTNGQLVLTAPGVNDTSTVDSVQSFDLSAGFSLVVEVAQVTPGSGDTYIGIYDVASPAAHSLWWDDGGTGVGVLTMQTTTGNDGGWKNVTPTTTYDPVKHRWARLRGDGTMLYMDTSPDGKTWTNLSSTPPTFNFNNCYVELSAGYGTGQAIFDNFTLTKTVVGTPNVFGTVEMWVRLDEPRPTWGAVYTGTGWIGQTGGYYLNGGLDGTDPTYPDGPYYVNGQPVQANTNYPVPAGQFIHIVYPFTGPPLNDWADFAGLVQDGSGDRFHMKMTLSHLAFYPQVMTPSEIASLYLYSSGGGQTITITDSDAVRVTEYSTPVNIYAYAWSIVSGNQS